MSIADPHCHTVASDGMATPRELIAAALSAAIDLIAVTDHDTMHNVQECVERGGEAGLMVIPGQEVTTAWPAQTHLLAWFLERPIKSGMSLLDTVRAVRDQGGLVIIPHPFMPTYFASCQPGMLRRLIEVEAVDGIEIVHTAPMGRLRQRRLEAFYAQHRQRLGAAIGSSDSHFGGHDLGGALTAFEGQTVADFRAAVESGQTTAARGRPRQVPATLALRQQGRSLVSLPLRRLLGQLP
ncbi:MAG TPA: PHP domain-containing protein [Candidatus Acidoferrales bacterium]|nr:PHP domain-containing protein [Candidatus Acidoferrales bacterium]